MNIPEEAARFNNMSCWTTAGHAAAVAVRAAIATVVFIVKVNLMTRGKSRKTNCGEKPGDSGALLYLSEVFPSTFAVRSMESVRSTVHQKPSSSRRLVPCRHTRHQRAFDQSASRHYESGLPALPDTEVIEIIFSAIVT